MLPPPLTHFSAICRDGPLMPNKQLSSRAFHFFTGAALRSKRTFSIMYLSLTPARDLINMRSVQIELRSAHLNRAKTMTRNGRAESHQLVLALRT